jgi:hypothetical protein
MGFQVHCQFLPLHFLLKNQQEIKVWISKLFVKLDETKLTFQSKLGKKWEGLNNR